jgi:heat shock protein HslJ
MRFFQKIILTILFLATSTVGFSACSTSAGALNLKGTQWQVIQINGAAVADSLNVSVAFGADGKVSGKAPCNSYFSDFKQSGAQLTFGMTGSTEMYCTDEGVMDLEQAFFQNLDKVAKFQFENDRLTLFGESGKALLVLKR